MPSGAPARGHVCLLCQRRFQTSGALHRHERLSELHKQNMEREDELVHHRKADILNGVSALRHKLAAAADAAQRDALESQLRQLLGEYSMAQEMLEYNMSLRDDGAAMQAKKRPRRTSHETNVGGLLLSAAATCWKGGKEVQEDRFLLDIPLRSADGHDVAGYCVLDGHSGSACVDFLADNMRAALQAALSRHQCLSEDALGSAVMEACARLDEDFLSSARRCELMDGSTMVLALFFPDGKATRLLVANVGDSRALLCRAAAPPPPEGGSSKRRLEQISALRLTEDHKPDRPDESRRIQARGGCVAHHGVWRVFVPSPVSFGGRAFPRWGLAVSRAFGDLLLKEPERYGCSTVAPGGLVISEPELKSTVVDPDLDRFLVVACDGVWDVLRDSDAISVCAGQAGPGCGAHALVRHSFAAGSGDNLTALVVAMRHPAAD